MRHKYRRRGHRMQFGGLLSGLLGGGSGKDLLTGISESLKGFSNEPALSNIFSQSDSLFNGFKEQAKSANANISNIDSMKPLFDIFSLFNGGSFGGGLFEDGGRVMSRKRINKRLSSIRPFVMEDIVDFESAIKMDKVKSQFNAKYSEDSASPGEIIPGMGDKKKGGEVSEKIKLLMKEGKPQKQAVAIALSMANRGKLQQGGIPVSPRGLFDYPGRPVVVPTPDGSITMNGVNQPIVAIDGQGGLRVLPPNSGQHQFAPGSVLEIPIGGMGSEHGQDFYSNTRRMLDNLRNRNMFSQGTYNVTPMADIKKTEKKEKEERKEPDVEEPVDNTKEDRTVVAPARIRSLPLKPIEYDREPIEINRGDLAIKPPKKPTKKQGVDSEKPETPPSVNVGRGLYKADVKIEKGDYAIPIENSIYKMLFDETGKQKGFINTMNGDTINVLRRDDVEEIKKLFRDRYNKQMGGVINAMLLQDPRFLNTIEEPTPRRIHRKKKKYTGESTTPAKTLKNFNERNRRLMYNNRVGNVGMPFGSIR